MEDDLSKGDIFSSESINEETQIELSIIGKIVEDMEKDGSSEVKEKIFEEFKFGDEGINMGVERIKSGEETNKSGDENINSGDDEHNESVMSGERVMKFKVVDQFGNVLDKEMFEKYYEGVYDGVFDENATEIITVFINERNPISTGAYGDSDVWNKELGGEEKVIKIESDDESMGETEVEKDVEVIVKEEEVPSDKPEEIIVEGSNVKEIVSRGRLKSKVVKSINLIPAKVVELKKRMHGYKRDLSEAN